MRVDIDVSKKIEVDGEEFLMSFRSPTLFEIRTCGDGMPVALASFDPELSENLFLHTSRKDKEELALASDAFYNECRDFLMEAYKIKGLF